MADVRETIVLDQLTTRKFWTPSVSLLARTKMRTRRLVVQTAPGLRFVYSATCRAHVRYAVARLREIAGTRAVYVGMGAIDHHAMHGVSDIDFFVKGDWTEEGQERVTQEIRRLALTPPLFDRASIHQVHTLVSLRAMFDTDYYFQFRFDQARHRFSLAYGDDVLAALPPVPAERARGGYYMETKIWWMHFNTSAFGDGPTSWDPIFRNSVAQKAAAGVLSMEAAVSGAGVEDSRNKAADDAIERLTGSDKEVLIRLQECWRKRYLRYAGDVQNDGFHFLLHRIEHIHAQLPSGRPFEAISGKVLLIDAPSDEVYRTEDALSHVRRAVETAKQTWPGHRNAFLLPRCSLAGIDDLQLLIEVDPARLPTVDQVRAVCQPANAVLPKQRVAICLLLPHGAYLLDRKTPLEFWHMLQTPCANPEMYGLLGRPEFLFEGQARAAEEYPWTTFAATLVEDEMRLRKSATAKAMAAAAGPSNPLLLLGGIWRHLQLDVMQRSVATGTV